MKLIETLMSVRQCIAKGYLSYDPGTINAFRWDQDTGYVIIVLQSTYLVYKKD